MLDTAQGNHKESGKFKLTSASTPNSPVEVSMVLLVDSQNMTTWKHYFKPKDGIYGQAM
jgi:hypothetical protein